MILNPLFDFGWGAAVILFGGMSLAVMVPVTILLETFVIRHFLHLSFRRSLLDAFVMNLASGILGFGWVVLMGPTFITRGEFLGADYNNPTDAAVFVALLYLLGTFCIISIAVEGLVLVWMERESPRSTIWLIASLSNFASYLVLFIIGIIMYV